MSRRQEAIAWLEQNLDVSRETLAALDAYATLIAKWNPRINLVSASTLEDLWWRHFVDSAQLVTVTPSPSGDWYDLGSGGGFPGLVVSLFLKQETAPVRIHCVESDQRKAAFLATVQRELDLPAQIIPQRVETLADNIADVVSARAFTPLVNLLEYGRLLKPGGTAVLLKGANYQKEIENALAQWRFDVQTTPSVTHPDAAVLRIKEISRV